MMQFSRSLEDKVTSALKRGKSILLLGARQTGKTTLLRQLPCQLFLPLADYRVRLKYEKDPGVLISEIEFLAERESFPLVILDEVQKVPAIMDSVQELIDRKIAQFILSGSSARKLKNLLPGRVLRMVLEPLSWTEIQNAQPPLKELLLYGSLPGIAQIESLEERFMELESYVAVYLEEEVRREALVRSLGAFTHFLELAAKEAGKVINLSQLSQDVGVAHTTISAFYSILEECLITERIAPITQSETRPKLTRTHRYLFFDLGLRRIAAGEGETLSEERWGELLEQWVGIECLRWIHSQNKKISLKFWRDPGGPEVDWVLQSGDRWIPIEVKWSITPSQKHTKHLNTFMKEYPQASKAYVICRTSTPLKLSPTIDALPWSQIHLLLKNFKGVRLKRGAISQRVFEFPGTPFDSQRGGLQFYKPRSL